MLDFTTYSYLGNSSSPLRLGALAPRPGRVVESGYSVGPLEEDLPLSVDPRKFSFSSPIGGRVVESGFDSPLVGEPEFNLFPSSSGLSRVVGGRVVESGYDAYDPSVQTGGIPDPVDPASTVEASDWGSLASSTLEDDWGTLDPADQNIDYGTLS